MYMCRVIWTIPVWSSCFYWLIIIVIIIFIINRFIIITVAIFVIIITIIRNIFMIIISTAIIIIFIISIIRISWKSVFLQWSTIKKLNQFLVVRAFSHIHKINFIGQLFLEILDFYKSCNVIAQKHFGSILKNKIVL